jgi:hypothetical protein
MTADYNIACRAILVECETAASQRAKTSRLLRDNLNSAQ